MMRKFAAITICLVLFCMASSAQASFTVVGTASYLGSDYNLIYDNDDTGFGGGGLVWLDYTHQNDTWQNQVSWASGLGSQLTINLNSGVSLGIDLTTGWRLPDTVDGIWVEGYEGDPDNDGIYRYTAFYNLANSEMGHLYYTELGNAGWVNTDGIRGTLPPYPDYFLKNTGDFNNLNAVAYSSGTEYNYNSDFVWNFHMLSGYQHANLKSNDSYYGIAVRSADSTVPVPSAIWLFVSGLASLATLRKRKSKNLG